MDQRGAIGLEQVVDAPEVGRILGAADVFEHANADDGVERALGVAVVLEPEFDLAVQSQFFDTSLGDCQLFARQRDAGDVCAVVLRKVDRKATRSEEHTSELQSLMRISYAVFCLKTKKNTLT